MTTRIPNPSPAARTCPYPAGLVALALATGIVAGDFGAISSEWWIACCAISVIGFFFPRNPTFRSASAIALVCLAGAVTQSLSREPAPDDVRILTDRLDRDVDVEVAAVGRISSFVVGDSTRARFYFTLERVHGIDRILPVSGNVRVTIRKESESAFRRGQDECSQITRGMRLVLRGALSRPNANTNPAGFDYREFLRRKGVSSLLYVRHTTDCGVVDRSSNRIAVIRNWFKRAIHASVPPSSRALPTALITGDRSGLDQATRKEFAESGLMHLLAISGLHVLFVGLAAYGLLKSTFARIGLDWRHVETVSSLATLALLSVYALMTGATPSVTRASIMAGVFLSSRPLFRTPNGLNSLGVAAVVVLLLDSNSLFTAGFQLSFSAVFGLITAGAFVTDVVNRTVSSKVGRWCFGLLGASAIATLSTAPIMVYQFGYVPLAGLLLNLAGIPLASVLLIASIFTTVFTGFWTSVAGAIGQATDLLSLFLEFLAGLGTNTASWTLVRPPQRLPYLALPVVLVFTLYPKIQRGARIGWLVIATLLPAIDLLAGAVGGRFSPDLEVIFFDVGHGDAALVEFPSGRTMLVDAGNRSLTWDYGDRVVLPHLHRERFFLLDAVVVSHPHGDHFGGLPSILKHHKVGCVYDNGKKTETALYREYERLAAEVVGCRRSLTAGSLLNLDPTTQIEVLAPPAGYEHEGENDESVVLRIRYGKTSILFTGDVEVHAEGILTDNYCDRLEADVIKVPHHGSRTSSTPDLVSCSKAAWAIVSVGKPDKYGLPDEEIIDRWKKSGATVLSTRSGAIQFRSNGRKIKRIQ